MSVAVGLRVMVEMMQDELTAKVGPKHAKLPNRQARRHASAPGSVVLGGRRVKVKRPRARTVEGSEVRLDTYAAFADEDLLGQVVMERMLAGLATRRHRSANEPVGEAVEAEASSTSRSSVSRRFVAGTAKALEELMARDLSGLAMAALMVDGVHFAEHCCVVAMAICADGTKVPVGLWLGDTENKTIVTHLLADLPQSTGACQPSPACWWSSTAPRPWRRGFARSSATRSWCSVVFCIMPSSGLCRLGAANRCGTGTSSS
jgi:putative transposase